MITEQDLVDVMEHLEAQVLRHWIDLGLIAPARRESGYAFDEADVAKVHLMCDLRYELGVDDESLPMVVSLVDQLHEARRTLRALSTAICEQPPDVRAVITARARNALSGAGGRRIRSP
jgi:chaperone modulatory protein CbpM